MDFKQSLCFTHMYTQEWQGQGSISHLMHTLPSYSQLGNVLGHTCTLSQHPQLCFEMLQLSHSQGQRDHYS